MKNILYTLLAVVLFSSCSEYQKALKSEDTATKFKLGTELYDAGKYSKANRLFEQIVPLYRGKPQAEKLTYLYAKSYYFMDDYYLAGYKFDQFSTAYPKSEKAEEASFLAAKSFYKLSPVYSKEQHETTEAIQKLQIFINKYPNSQYLEEANTLMKELEFKLEKKAYSIAKQYNTIAYYEASDYEAAIKAFDNFLVEFPGTSFREDAMYYRFESAQRLAVNSMVHKKEARIDIAIGYYNALKRAFENSKYKDEAEKMHQQLQTELELLKTNS